ncbi:conserved hypothetical protein [Neospora caninum Liverpool]|uniref:Uncharacterized protein n=1 Tax=Neospora caninum (strain Liverpool) TaxID=572307 RepID=F0V863_NEOCL|nr:conserved hypothetical protein [Neospora caninum Liverpool]CBZ49904.1 conserved hypothetical protein [Neospora caninum Liverpool]CEL64491.1 TPA: hypothetical protein BN1204_003880 [Neospora caninum Liverpool]|eukprot:XP_003879939.1 conserved hypothetical protein [Neospora caninum Liverpool]
MMCTLAPKQPYGPASFFPYDVEERLQTESPGAPTVYMPSPISGNVLPPRGSPETIDASTKNQVPRIFPALCSDQDPPASTSVAAPRSQLLSQLARICGLVAGSVTIATGVSRILKAAPSLQWPEENLLDEVNDELWRRKLFLLNPGEILDLWAPLVFGALSFLTHFRLFEITTITCNFSRYSLWNLAQALYANFGYSGVLGLVGGALSTCTSCLSLISAVCLMDSQASLRLEIGLLPLPRTSRALKSDHNLEAVQVGP